MEHLGFLVHFSADAVPAILTHDRITMLLGVSLDGEADVAHMRAGADLPELEDDAQGDAKGALSGVVVSLAALGKGSAPEHDDGPDPDEYEMVEEDESL